LLDQMVRQKSGGGMLNYLAKSNIPNQEFVFSRIGDEGKQIRKRLASKALTSTVMKPHRIHQIRHELIKYVKNLPGNVWQKLLHVLLGDRGMNALSIGQFRLGGEVHQWMYDRYSLLKLLEKTGFQSSVIQAAHSSHIPNWPDYGLDVLPDGTPVKPDLLFAEAFK
jgi:hypothetical protein